jgi:hypothetical protein
MKKLLGFLGTFSLVVTPTFGVTSCGHEDVSEVTEINNNYFDSFKFSDYMNNHLGEFNFYKFNPSIKSKTLLTKIKDDYLKIAIEDEKLSNAQKEDILNNVKISFTFGDRNATISNDQNETMTLLKGQLIINFDLCSLFSGELIYDFDLRPSIESLKNYLQDEDIKKITDFDFENSNDTYQNVKNYLLNMVQVISEQYNANENLKNYFDVTLLQNKINGNSYFENLINSIEVITLSNDFVVSGYDSKTDTYETKVDLNGLEVASNQFSSQFFSFVGDKSFNLEMKNAKQMELNTEVLKQFDGTPPSSATEENYNLNWINLSGFNLENTMAEIEPVITDKIFDLFHNNEQFKGSGLISENVNFIFAKSLSGSDDFYNGGYRDEANIWYPATKLSAITKGKDFDPTTGTMSNDPAQYIKIFNILFLDSNASNISIVNDGEKHRLCSFHFFVVLDDVKNNLSNNLEGNN